MPAVLSYPGVYIDEVPSAVRTIAGVATSVVAFVGRTKLGPDNRPVVINSWADFERRFGGLWEQSPLSVAVRDFFQNGGGQAVIVRVFSPTLGSLTGAATVAAEAVAKAAEDAVAGAADAQAVADAAKVKADSYTDGSVEAAAGDAVAKAADDFAKATGNAAKKQETADQARGAVTAAVAAAAEGKFATTTARLVLGSLKLVAASPGSWANDLRARIDVPDASGLFTLTVRDHDTRTIEQFANLSLDAGHVRRVDRVLERESTLVRLDGTPPGGTLTATALPGKGKQWWEDPNSPDPVSYAAVADGAKGSDGDAPTDTIVEGSAAAKTGLYALDGAEDVNLLCIPPHDFDAGDIGTSLIEAAITYCVNRRAVLLLDPPSAWKTKDVARSKVDSVSSASPNAAVYFPRILRPSPFPGDAGAIKAYVPCGAVAGVIARTDTNRGIWKAPAGLDATLSNVPQLEVPLTDAENGELNPKGLNCLRTFPAAGRVVWGARTRVGADSLANEWKYLPVRRTALYIEESLYRGTKWVVFEPNDEPLWASIRLNVGSFMHELFRQGAFQGATPREAYFVRCDKDTTTQADIDRGVVNILVGFAPLKPAEFVVIRLQQMAGQIQA
ncbi:MAG TPA: phage tail sheath C-terminal domain-containing protein [Sphingomonas sp.]|nr:phage tail sheath C-terminal domain-containing protein [Sphingomonas sp.]